MNETNIRKHLEYLISFKSRHIGHKGSAAAVEMIREKSLKVDYLINLDTVGGAGALEEEPVYAYVCNEESREIAGDLAEKIITPLVKHTVQYYDDHGRFWDGGLRAFEITELRDPDFIHTEEDNWDKVVPRRMSLLTEDLMNYLCEENHV